MDDSNKITPPTLIDVAKHANVSKSTVSLVLNNTGRISPQTVARVWEAIEELNYVPSRSARALQSGRSQLLGLIVSDITNPYFSELARTVSMAVNQSQYDLITFDTDYNANLQTSYLEHLRSFHIDGLFVFTTERDANIISQLEQANIPAVLLNWGMTGKNVGEIAVEYISGIETLLDHLIELGHRQLAFVQGPSNFYSAEERVNAFRTVVAQRQDVLAEPLYLKSDFRLGANPDIAVVDQILEIPKEDRPTAVIASNDLMAISLLRALFSRGVNVPSEISVVGMDDILLTNYTTPSLTSLRLPRRQMGLQAFDMLQRLMKKETDHSQERISVTMRLILRESIGLAYKAENSP